jgi:hypothetical protein
MNQSEQINELSKALSTAQSQMTFARKDSKNPFFKSSYADLSSVWDACREPLTKNGLAVIQTFDSNHDENTVIVVTTLTHSSGQWINSRLKLPLVKKDPQGLGSAITYGRRYSLAAIVGVIADEDDDGNAATHGKAQTANTAPAMVTTAQLTKINTVLTKQGVNDREHKLARVNSLLGEKSASPVKSSKELTRDQASMIIEELESPGPVEKWTMTEMDAMPREAQNA